MNRSDWCDFHDGPSGTARVVQRVERNGASPAVYYACRPCREQRRLTPVDSVETLARTRMQSTGETYEQALAALRGEPRPPDPEPRVLPFRREGGA